MMVSHEVVIPLTHPPPTSRFAGCGGLPVRHHEFGQSAIERIRLRVNEYASAASLHPLAQDCVEPGKHTDGCQSYSRLD